MIYILLHKTPYNTHVYSRESIDQALLQKVMIIFNETVTVDYDLTTADKIIILTLLVQKKIGWAELYFNYFTRASFEIKESHLETCSPSKVFARIDQILRGYVLDELH